jgi:hypothetical protein
MKFSMSIAGKLIDSLSIDFTWRKDPSYIPGLKQHLLDKHQALIQASVLQPVFFIDNVPSKMNKNGNLQTK